MAAAYPIRPISEEEFGAFYAVIEHAFNAPYPTDLELRHEMGVFEFDRSLAAFDGAAMAGTAAALSLRMTVPVDEPLLYLLADRRRGRPWLYDGLWVRLVSVPEALAGRRYSCPVDVVIEVADDVFAENTGRWRLRAPGRAEDGRATCERTSAAADVTLPVQSLGAAYMGGTTLGALAGAGLAEQARPGAIAALSSALSWEPAPWSPTIF